MYRQQGPIVGEKTRAQGLEAQALDIFFWKADVDHSDGAVGNVRADYGEIKVVPPLFSQ